MIALDTNVLVRFLTRDDEAQYRRSRALFGAEDVFIATTVFLETDWVLRTAYGYTPTEVAEALSELAGLPTVRLERSDRLALALTWARDGMDFADALHLAAAQDCGAFASFDRKVARVATKLGATPVREP